jgi:hypothetical protein
VTAFFIGLFIAFCMVPLARLRGLPPGHQFGYTFGLALYILVGPLTIGLFLSWLANDVLMWSNDTFNKVWILSSLLCFLLIALFIPTSYAANDSIEFRHTANPCDEAMRMRCELVGRRYADLQYPIVFRKEAFPSPRTMSLALGALRFYHWRVPALLLLHNGASAASGSRTRVLRVPIPNSFGRSVQ